MPSAIPGAPSSASTATADFGWSVQELSTARKYNLNVAIVVFNDGYFGNVKKMQQDQFGQEFGVDLLNPDFSKLADAFFIPYRLVDEPVDLEIALREHLGSAGPVLIEARVGPMRSPWHLLRLVPPPFAAGKPAPPNPLGDPVAKSA